MLTREATINLAGRTFTGRYAVTGEGNAASVMVQYQTAVICARKGRLPEEEVAETLLGELVKGALVEGEKARQH